MERRNFTSNDFHHIEWSNRRATLIGVQVDKRTRKATIWLGFPFAGEELTEAEAIDIADSFASTTWALFNDMREHLARRRAQ